MRYLFIVQGEGRGHLTQAMTLCRLLTDRGHQVAEVMVGTSPQRKIPSFFAEGISAKVTQYESMNFMPSAENRRPNIFKTVIYNTFRLYKYLPSVRFVRDRIKRGDIDVVVNFYELMPGVAYMFYKLDVPMVCIGHQYLFLHNDFGLPRSHYPGSHALDLFSGMTSVGAVKRLALSFKPMDDDPKKRIKVVPPLLRKEVMNMQPSCGTYIHGYMLNSGFADDVRKWHRLHPEVELRFFWDRWDVAKVYKEDENLTFYQIDADEFMKQMSGCRAFASTAGFESVCEAIWLGKPILMVPSHIEQEINVFDASRYGAGIGNDKFDLSCLLDFAEGFKPKTEFRSWASSAADIIVKELENVEKCK